MMLKQDSSKHAYSMPLLIMTISILLVNQANKMKGFNHHLLCPKHFCMNNIAFCEKTPKPP